MAFRFLHMADVHLDTPFAGREALRGILRRTLRETFEAAVNLAVEERVHAVLIAGDLFDSENLSFAAIRMLRDQAARLLEAGIAVVYATGNHDASGALPLLDLPAEVIVFDSPKPRFAEIRDGAGQPVGVVAGAGYPQAFLRENIAVRFPRKDSRLPTVGLLHTQLTELAGAGTDYAPCGVRDLAAAGYDYWALGHVHKPQSFENGSVWYPGCLCGRDFGETGPRGAVLACVEDGHAQTRFVPLSPIEWLDVAVDGLDEVFDLGTLQDRMLESVARQMGAAGAVRMMARVRLAGPCPLYRELTGPAARENLESLAQELAGRLKAMDVTVTARVVRPAQTGQWRGKPHMLSEMLDMIDEASADDEVMDAILREIPADVGLYGAQGRTAAEIRDYARRLLPELASRVCDQMVKEDE